MVNHFDIHVLISVIGWIAIGLLVLRSYKKKLIKPKVWKVLIVVIIGLLSFSIKWVVFGKIMNVAILPLGVWILYFFMRKNEEKWQHYRSFAWIGFLGNYIFLSLSLVMLPIHFVLYPPKEPTTYIANVENASVISSHSSVSNVTLNKEMLQDQLNIMKETPIYSDEWYLAIREQKKERFPYILINTLPKWGSGIATIIYVENDGKGLLITSDKQQQYYRFNQSVLEEGDSK